MIFGDSAEANLTSAQRAAGNLLGKPYRHYDEAGLLTFAAYDFKANVLVKKRRVLNDWFMLGMLPLDWQPPGSTLADQENAVLESNEYGTVTTYDARETVSRPAQSAQRRTAAGI